MKYLFPNFLSSETEYEQSIQFWNATIATCLSQNDDQWDRWLNETFVDGTRMMDGNPIYSLLCKKRRRAFSINQRSPNETTEFRSHVKYAFGDDLDDPTAVELLVIICKLTPDNALKAQKMISLWVKNDTSFEVMEALINFEEREGGGAHE